MARGGGSGGLSSRESRRRPAIAAALAAAVLLAAASLAGCGDSGHGRARASGVTSSFGRMAGYVWRGSVQSLQATWTVPAILPGSPAGHASTWIGTQTSGASSRAPFIQVGITEDRVTSAGSSAARSVYGTFWSDTAHGFHPVSLFAVHPGDRVQASLSLTGSRWRVLISDPAANRRASFSTTEETGRLFGLAEWLQEDPTKDTGGAEPYPRLSPIGMSRLIVNGRVPAYSTLFAQWMSVDGGALAPTPVSADAFALHRAGLTAAGRRYLVAAERSDLHELPMEARISQWSAATSPAEIRSDSSGLAAALAADDARLARTTWPHAAHRLVAQILRRSRAQIAMLRAAPRQAPRGLVAWRARFAADSRAISATAHMLRRALRVPEFGTPGTAF